MSAVFLIVLLMSLPYAFAKKPVPEAEPSWSVYVPIGNNGIQSSGKITCVEDECPPALLSDGYDEYFIYKSPQYVNNTVSLEKSSPSSESYTYFKFQVLLDNSNLVRPGIEEERTLGCDLTDPVDIGCVMTQPQPYYQIINEEYTGFTNIILGFYSYLGYDIETQPTDVPEDLF